METLFPSEFASLLGVSNLLAFNSMCILPHCHRARSVRARGFFIFFSAPDSVVFQQQEEAAAGICSGIETLYALLILFKADVYMVRN